MPEPAAFTPATWADTLPRDSATFAPSNIRTDPLRWLPQPAADRLQQLQLHVSDLRALCPPFDERNAAANAKIEAENRLKRLLDSPQQGGFGLGDSDQSVVDSRRQLKQVTAEAARLTALNETQSPALAKRSPTAFGCPPRWWPSIGGFQFRGSGATAI